MLTKDFRLSELKCAVTFSVPKEAFSEGAEVRVVGDFNDWDWDSGLTMQLEGDEYKVTAELPVDEAFEFRYRTQDEQWENDWAADGYIPTPFGVDNSVITLTHP